MGQYVNNVEKCVQSILCSPVWWHTHILQFLPPWRDLCISTCSWGRAFSAPGAPPSLRICLISCAAAPWTSARFSQNLYFPVKLMFSHMLGGGGVLSIPMFSSKCPAGSRLGNSGVGQGHCQPGYPGPVPVLFKEVEQKLESHQQPRQHPHNSPCPLSLISVWVCMIYFSFLTH